MNITGQASDKIEEFGKRVKVAEEVMNDLGGKSRDGITLTQYGDYVMCDDGQDRWLTLSDDYSEALEEVVESVLEGKLENDGGDCYGELCSNCSVLYSRIGSGNYNNDIDELRKMLEEGNDYAKPLDEETIEDIFRELGIEVEQDA